MPTPEELEFFEELWDQTVPDADFFDAGDAVVFLRQSGLPDPVLHTVWGQSDPEETGTLDKQGFFTALKLVALAQNNKEIDVALLDTPTPLPTFGQASDSVLAKLKAKRAAAANSDPPLSDTEWAVSEAEQKKFRGVFEGLKPVDGKVSGRAGQQVLMQSKLPTKVLGVIWELSDIDKDGKLDFEEFAVAMHLVHRSLAGKDMPATLPPALIPPSRRGGATEAAPAASETQSIAEPASDWVVTAKEKATFDKFFEEADTEKAGLVTGQNLMPIFMSSKLSTAVLAHVWNLCDTHQKGALNSEQFALAMHLISRKVKGTEVPQALPPNFIPPSCRGEQVTPVNHSADPPAAATQSATASASPGDSAPLTQAKEQLAAQKQAVESLKQDVAQQQRDTVEQKAELVKVLADVEKLKGEEKVLREQFKAGKAKLADLVTKIKTAKAEQAKLQSTLSRLSESKAKIDSSLKQYSNVAQQAAAGAKLTSSKLGPAQTSSGSSVFQPSSPWS